MHQPFQPLGAGAAQYCFWLHPRCALLETGLPVENLSPHCLQPQDVIPWELADAISLHTFLAQRTGKDVRTEVQDARVGLSTCPACRTEPVRGWDSPTVLWARRVPPLQGWAVESPEGWT